MVTHMKFIGRPIVSVIAVGLLLGFAACSSDDTPVNASGSVLIYPAMAKWTESFSEKNKPRVRYRSIGAAAGLREFLSSEVAFACVEGKLLDKELDALKKTNRRFILVPLALSAIVPAYNLETAGEPVRFSTQVLAAILRGKIDTWNDPLVQKLNPDSELPATKISVVFHGNENRDTLVASSHLSQVDKLFKDEVGEGISVRWPVGIGVRGGEGITAEIRRNPGSIALINLANAKNSNCVFGSIQNRAGKFSIAESKSIAAAASNAKAGKTEPLEFTHADGEKSYPLCFSIFAVFDPDHPQARDASEFLQWALTDGQRILEEFGHAPLPEAVVRDATKALK